MGLATVAGAAGPVAAARLSVHDKAATTRLPQPLPA